jgi:hypothetical protein
MPLLDLMTSQGQPCVRYTTDLNSLGSEAKGYFGQSNKKFELLNDGYAGTCPELYFGDEIFTNDETFR